jgi:NAD(P)-dependent dehydrogenase (short-subunit alcohol dehydrogenase family)
MRRAIRSVLVSGALGGLGSAVTRALSGRGVTVFAADLSDAVPSGSGAQAGIIPITMDVTDEKSVAAAVGAVERELAIRGGAVGLDGLVCAAGVFTGGALAEECAEALTRAFDVNVMGAYRLIKAAFPLLRRSTGTVILISSESARFSMPFNGPYTIGKCALEAYADCLRRELLNTGVKVAVVQPGSFRSVLLRDAGNVVGAGREGSLFTGQIDTVRRFLCREWSSAMSAERVAAVVVRALDARKPRLRYRVGNNVLRTGLRFLPPRAADALIRRFL